MATRDVSSPTTARFEGVPAESLSDEPVNIRITGLEPAAPVTLRARLQEENGQWWESATSFVADAAGTVDLASQAPAAGGYDGADPMGFLWSMAPARGAHVDRPYWPMTVAPTTVELTAEANGTALETSTLQRHFMGPGVTRTPVRDEGLVATFFAPAASIAPEGHPAPAIIVVPGSGGGLNETTAALFASHGFPALALAYFRAEHLPANLVRIPLEYIETAINWLLAQPSVNGNVAFSGASRGGELSLLVGATFPELIKAVIAYVPSGIVYGGLAGPEHESDEPLASWTLGGEPVRFLGSHRDRGGPPPAMEEGVGFALTPGFLATLEDAAEAEAAAIPVETIRGPVLLISGDQDAMWPSSVFSNRVMERLAAKQHPYPDQHLAYPDAGHLIGPPYVPTTVRDIKHNVTGGYFALGGTPSGSAFARSDHWPKVLAFLDQLRS